MLIAPLDTLQPVDHMAAFANTSFPVTGPSDEFLAEQGYAKVNVFRDHDRATQRLVACDPYYEAPWVYTVRVEDKTPEDLQQETDAKASEIRAQRNALLAACDWTQLADAPVDSALWAAYRQTLRDVPSQAGFPWQVDWPVAPS